MSEPAPQSQESSTAKSAKSAENAKISNLSPGVMNPADGKGASGVSGDAPEVSAVGKSEVRNPKSEIEAALAMASRPGWKTTEFLFLIGSAALAQWMVATGRASGDFANALTFGSGLVYMYFRQVHKADIFGQAAAAAQNAVPQINSTADFEAVVTRQLAAHQGQIITMINAALTQPGAKGSNAGA